MTRHLIAILFILTTVVASAQKNAVESMQRQLATAKKDTAKISLLMLLVRHYTNVQPDTSFYYAQRLVQLSQKSGYPYGEGIGFFYLARALDRQGNYPKALEMAYRCLRIAEKLESNKNYLMSLAYSEIGLLNRLTGDDSTGLINLRHAIQFGEQSESDNEYLYHFYTHLAAIFISMNKLDSALYYAQKGYHKTPQNEAVLPFALSVLGNVYEKLGNNQQAKECYRLAIQTGSEYNSLFFMAVAKNTLAKLFLKTGALDSCIYYAKEALALSMRYRYQLYAMNTSSLLSQVYELQNKTDSTLKYMKVMLSVKDSVFNQSKMQQFQLIAFDEQQRQQQLKAAEERYQNQLHMYVLLGLLFIFLLLAVILYRNNQQKQKANRKIETAYEELKSTQTQLVKREKMASLGELTAGIAHEIQNPLNFVNNFSEVSTELIEEMKQELKAGNSEEAVAIAGDLGENLTKINHHGKRADAIVRAMLQHSRTSTGKKEPTDINALADEYLRLSYHGLRAKDNAFNANIKTDFDKTIGKIELAPQEIGRVLLNLYNNAFYSVNEKKKQLGEVLSAGQAGLEPTVIVSTKRVGNKLELSVKDNGTGIPQKVLDKIYQPFFTTKPPGQGTGLGLSLSYDVIKAHGGELKVETKEGEFTEFVITIPFNNHA